MGVPPTVVRAFGPIAVESELCARLRSERDRVRVDPRLLSSPLVVVTPSDGLRVHLAGLAARTVGALAGVRFVTIARLAHETLARAGVPGARGSAAADILVDRAARACFPGADERFGTAAAASIVDLLDAGLAAESGPALHDALDDASDRPPLARSAREAATAIVRGALAARAALDATNSCRTSDVLARAALILQDDDGAAGCRSVLIHGFTDATGVQADFLQALSAARPTTILWDEAATARRYGAALRARFAIPERDADGRARSRPTAFRARGAEAEVRGVLRRVRRLLDQGVVPERIAIVARRTDSYSAALRTHAARLAIPFSGDGVRGPASAKGRRIRARIEVLLDPRASPLSRWFAAHESRLEDELALQVGLSALGAGRLGDLADLDVALALGDRDELRLPIRVARAERSERERGSEDEEDEESAAEDGETDQDVEVSFEDSRSLPRKTIEAAVASARTFVARAVDPRPEALAREHAVRIESLLTRLGAGPDDDLVRATRDLAQELGPDFRASPREFHDALVRRTDGAHDEQLGGRGGGVLVADASTARARSFEHLFVMGLNAGVFPAAAREDALLADEARARIAACLPDLSLKRARAEEESAIFAQLLSGAPHITLSWLTADAEDVAFAPSPFLDLAGVLDPDTAKLAPGPIERDEGVAQPLVEHAQLAGRDGTAVEAAGVLELALGSARKVHGLDPARAVHIAVARAATLVELDRVPGRPEPLGPFFGAVGAARLEARTRSEIAVTTIENVARCPWQTFLQRVLKIRPPIDPLLFAPRIDARATGSVAHALLAETTPVQGRELEEVEETAGLVPDWRSIERLQAQALLHAARILREEGRFAPGLDALVAARALELVETARRIDAAEPSLRVLGAEIHARAPIPGGRWLGFRADRVERVEDRLRLTDWKSGKVFGDFATPDTRARHHLAAIRSGAQLQAFVYALVGGTGRYVALHPHFAADDRRLFEVTGDDPACTAAYESALKELLAAWDTGAFFPRLVEYDVHKENSSCAHCELAAACVRGDSGARQRFTALVQRTDDLPPDSHEALVRRVFALQKPEQKPGKSPSAAESTAKQKPSGRKPKDAS